MAKISPFPWPNFNRVLSSNQQDNELELGEEAIADAATLKSRSVTGAIAFVMRTFAIQVTGLLANFALSIFLTPEEFGVYFIVTALIGLFTFLSDVGLAATLVQQPKKPTLLQLRTTFSVQQLLALLIFGLLVALTPYWRRFQHLDTQELYLLYALGFSFVLASLKTIPSIILERQLRFDRVVIPALVENISFYVIVVILAWKNFGVSSYTYAVLVRSFLGVVAMYAVQSWPIGLAFDWPTFRGMLNFGAKFQLNDLLARLKDELLVVFLGWLLGKTGMGYVGWAKKWSMFPYTLTVQSVLSVTFPTFSRIQEEKERLRKAIEKSLFFITLLAFPLLSGIGTFIYPLVIAYDQFEKWQPAAISLSLFAASIGLAAISTPLTNALMAIGQINKNLYLMIIWTIMTWTITPLMVWWLGYHGVAAAAVVIGLTSVVLPVYFIKQYVPHLQVWPQIWSQLIASLAIITIGVVGLPYWSQSLPWLLCGIVIAGLGYVLVFLAIAWRRLISEVRSLGVLPWLN